MPLYEYFCPTCGHKFEKLQPMTAAGADCTNCEQPARRAVSVFASVAKGGEEPTAMNPLPPISGGGCCGGGCGCGH